VLDKRVKPEKKKRLKIKDAIPGRAPKREFSTPGKGESSEAKGKKIGGARKTRALKHKHLKLI